jgi:hypothetical protein
MITRPNDITDLYLSPIALELDRRLKGLDGLSSHDLDVQVTLATDRRPVDTASRSALMLENLTHLLPLHGWELSWVHRGLLLSHGEHQLVLGVPDSVREYITD